VNGTVMNNPSDGSERAVANGMLMCNLVAKSQSTTFSANDAVRTTASANVRQGRAPTTPSWRRSLLERPARC